MNSMNFFEGPGRHEKALATADNSASVQENVLSLAETDEIAAITTSLDQFGHKTVEDCSSTEHVNSKSGSVGDCEQRGSQLA
eukprot:11878427-Karenia_brevis.AAC.1